MEKLKELREKTGAGMVDCKKALDEANGDIEKAIEILRKKGISKAAKRGERDTSEGLIMVKTNSDNTEGYILEVNSETDFVARNDHFKAFTNEALDLIISKKPNTLEDLLALPMATGPVAETLANLSGVIGEKLAIKAFAVLPGQTVVAYSHMGGRIGVLVALSETGKVDLATDIAMQIAAANPKYLVPAEVPIEEIEKEKEIYREQLKKEGKPENMLENILTGKINKYYEDVCLVKQEFIKEDKKKVEDILGSVKVEKFIRYSL